MWFLPPGSRRPDICSRVRDSLRDGLPHAAEELREKLHGLAGKNVLVIHQQIAANEIRREIRDAASVVCATWFMQLPEYRQPQDVVFEKEENDGFCGKRKLRCDHRRPDARAEGFDGAWIHVPHFAVSGEYEDD